MIAAAPAARTTKHGSNDRSGVESAIRSQVAQATGVLELVHPKSHEVVVFDANDFLFIDFRLILGESILLAQIGRMLRIVFADGTIIEISNFFDGGDSPPSDHLVQIDDATYLSPALFFRDYATEGGIKDEVVGSGSGSGSGGGSGRGSGSLDAIPIDASLLPIRIDAPPNAVAAPLSESPALIAEFQPPPGAPSLPLPPALDQPPPLPPLPPIPPIPPLPPSNSPPEFTGAINTGSVTEDVSTTASGLMLFSDLDLANTHTVSVTPSGAGYLGTLAASVIADPSGAAGGALVWSFAVASAGLQFLAAGEEITQIYTITVHDGAGGTSSEDVAITIVGTNDNPLITGAVIAGTVTEDSSATASGTIDFNDVDLVDTHTVLVTPAGTGYLGTLTASVSNPSTGDGSGQVVWSFTATAAALQFLAAGQQLTQTYTIAIDDGAGGTEAQDVTVTITGTNDIPVVTAADVVGDVEEDVSPTASGTIEFGDVDLTDAHTVSANPAAGGYLGTFTASLSDPATGDGSGQVTWSFSIDDELLRSFPEGQVLTQTYTITIDDGAGGTVSQDVVILIREHNDAPVITGAVAAGGVNEDAPPTTASGTIDFSDADLTNVHTVSATPAAGGYLGIFTASLSDPATGDGSGEVTWSFTVDNALLQTLSEGQVSVQTYTVAIDDGAGGIATQAATITITGTNDGPAITGAVAAGVVTEDAPPAIATGTIDFGDVDLADAHTVSVDPAGAGYLGALFAQVSDPSTGDGSGRVTWTFVAAASALQFLADGEVLTQLYTIEVDDGAGGTVAQDVTVIITGSNDAPVVTAAIASGSVTEDVSPTTSGTIDFADVDLTDAHTVAVTPAGGGYIGTFTAGLTNPATGDGSGQVTWTFTIDNTLLQTLSEGQVFTQTYTVVIDDGAGGTVAQDVVITINELNDTPVITGAVAAGAVTEDTPPTAATGTIDFSDDDLGDTHTVSVTPADVGYVGALIASITDPATGDGGGQVTWTFAVAPAALQYLADGEILTQTYTVAIDDGAGGIASQDVTITLTGTNDGPAISGGVGAGDVTEDVSNTASGSIDFGDVDLADTHTVSVTPLAGGYLGTLTATVSDLSTGDGSGQVTWSFTVADAALQFLAEGEQLTQTYTITVDDGAGGTVAQDVTVTITGSNDAPVVTAAIASGSVMEDVSPTTSGTIDFADVDLSDAHAVAVVPPPVGYVGTFTASLTDSATGDGSGRVTWTFTIDNTLLRTLPEGQVFTQSYTVVVDDGMGGTVAQDVVITINELNDTPVITGAVTTGAVTENAPPTTATGTIDFSDDDLGDTHAVSVTPAGIGYLGTLAASITDPATDGSGQVTWGFTVADAALQFLAAGEVLTQTYTIAIDDGAGGVVMQAVAITITGTNDGPVITGALVAGGVTEDTLPTAATGTIDFGDVDLADTHTVSVTPLAGGYLGALTASVTNPATGDGSGRVTWDFTVAAAELQFLAAGEQLIQTYTVAIDDGAGGTVTQDVIMTITGSNDAPVVTAAIASGSVMEDVSPTTSGTIDFGDVDLTDVHTVSSTPAAGGYVGTFTASLVSDATGDGSGQVSWTFTIDNTFLRSLAEGTVFTQTYTVVIDDGLGGTVAQAVVITINELNDTPVITGAVATGAVTENAPPPTATGTIDFSDDDLGDTHTVSVTPAGNGYLGTLTASITNPASGDGSGHVTWNFAVVGAALQFLAAGEQLIQTYTLAIDDGAGGTVTQAVTITITGTNDGPAITGAVVDGGVTEDVATTASGTIDFGDVDLADAHTVSVTPAASGYLGTLTASVSDPATGDGSGQVTWSFTVADAGLQFLAAGEVLTQIYTVAIDDGAGGTVAQDVTVTITGAGDAPVVTGAINTGSVTEDTSTTASGLILFGDVDLTDTHTVSVTPDDTGYLGTLTASVSNPSSGDGSGRVTWNFAVAAAALQFLAAGEELTQVYTIAIDDDGAGGIASQDVTITLTGTNDGPVITAADTVGGVTEDVPPTTATGTIDFGDVDLADAHIVSVTPVGTGYLGALTASVTNPATGGGSGRVTWDFTVADATLQFLAAGEFLTQTYTIAIDDGAGGTVAQDVIVTITGSNDAPVVTAAIASGSVMEDVSPTTSGTIDFGDVDVTDAHTVSSIPAAGGYVGTFTASLVDDATGDGSGQVTWTFTIDNTFLRSLAEGTVFTQTYTVVIDDGLGGTVTQDVVITINELNDIPVITGAVTTGAVTENALPTTATGTIDFSDDDLGDTHTVSVTPAGTGYLGTLTASITNPSTGDGSGQVTWDFTVADAALQFLAAGEALTQTYTLAIDDGVGGTVTQAVTITITGANDGPVITGAVATGSVTEDAPPTTATGTIDFGDVDLADTHAVSVTPAGTGYLGTLTASAGNPSTGDGSGQVTWSFTVAPAALQSLTGNQQLVQTYTVTIDDGTGGTVAQDVTITITGANDAPIAVNDAANTSATPLLESNTQATSELIGTASLLVNDSDVDAGETAALRVTQVAGTSVNPTVGVETAIAGIYGTVFVRADGSYRYVLDNTDPDTQALAADQAVTESFLYTAANNGGGAANEASATLSIAIAGADDTPVITGPTAGTVAEAGSAGAGTPAATDDLLATDVDGPDDQWQPVSVPTASVNGYGTFTLTAAGVWTYTLDNANLAVGALNNGQTLSDSFTVLTSDGTAQMVSITVQGANDGPATDLNGFGPGSGSAATFTEDAGAVVIAPAATIADIDDANIESMTVTLTNRPDGVAFESLSLNAAAAVAAAVAGLAVSYSAVTGVLSINGSASEGTYETILRGVQYNNTDQAPDTSARIVHVTVSDGDVSSAITTAVITVVAVNDPPGPITDTDGSFNSVFETANPGTPVQINVNAVDPEGGPVTYSLLDSADGRFAINPVTGVVTVASALDFGRYSSHTITVQASDSLGAVTTASFTINVVNVVPDSNDTVVIDPATGFFGPTVQDTDGGDDRIEFTSDGIVFTSLNFENIDELTDDLRISWSVPGVSDFVDVVDHFGPDTIEYLSFAGGASYLGYQLGGVTYRLSTQNANPLDGTSSNDVIASNTSGQVLNGFDGNDLLFGNAGFDTLNGGSGDDLLVGGTGDDRLNGGDGDDVLFGGPDNDTIDGGPGLDRFVYRETVNGINRDTVNNYNGTGPSKDVFDLSELLNANFGLSSDVSDFVRLQSFGQDILLQVDTNGPLFGSSFSTVATITGYNISGSIVSVFFEGAEHQLLVM